MTASVLFRIGVAPLRFARFLKEEYQAGPP